MTISKLGIKKPEAVDNCYGVRGVYNEETGMSGYLLTNAWPVAKASRFFMTTEHDDVGLVTWFEAPSLEEANTFLDKIKKEES